MPFDNPHQTEFNDIELLLDARNRLSNKDDWLQRRYQQGNRFCLVAALSVAAGSQDFQRPNKTERRLARLVVAQLPDTVPSLVRLRLITARQRLMLFNDSPRTKHEDVVALVGRAIDCALSRAPAYVSALEPS
jgi:hypothetical protein